MPQHPTKLGQVLSALLRDRFPTREAAAQYLGISLPTLRRVLAGGTPAAHTLASLCAFLNQTEEVVLGWARTLAVRGRHRKIDPVKVASDPLALGIHTAGPRARAVAKAAIAADAKWP